MDLASNSTAQAWALAALIGKADTKDPKPADVVALRKALAEHPELWRLLGDLALRAREQVLAALQVTPAVHESVRHGIEEIQRELGDDTAPLLERLLIEQVVLCWLRLNLTESQYTLVERQGGSLAELRYWEYRLGAAQQRYLRAIETLARVRKLAQRTPLQVNIGGQQVIAAGDLRVDR